MTRGLRILSLAALIAFPMLMGGMVGGMMLMLSRQARSVPVETRVVSYVLRELDRRSDPKDLGPADRDAVEIVLASRYRSVLADQTIYAPERFLLLTPAHKTLADRILRRHVDPHTVDAAAARPAVRGMLEEGARFELPPIPAIALMLFYGTLMVVALLALVAALATRGVMLRLLGFEIVTADGRLAPRWRVLARAAIAWSPILLPLLVWSCSRASGRTFPT